MHIILPLFDVMYTYRVEELWYYSARKATSPTPSSPAEA
jgi:hypothetical protein